MYECMHACTLLQYIIHTATYNSACSTTAANNGVQEEDIKITSRVEPPIDMPSVRMLLL